MTKTLLILAHPNMPESKVNKALIESIAEEPNITVHDLYQAYRSVEAIDVEKEQALLLAHDRIIFQFPLYWFSSPAILKEWLDVVLAYGFAYGHEGNKLAGKKCKIVISAGSPEAEYSPVGYNRYTLAEYLRPLESSILYTKMEFKGIFAVCGALELTAETLPQEVGKYRAMLKNEGWM